MENAHSTMVHHVAATVRTNRRRRCEGSDQEIAHHPATAGGTEESLAFVTCLLTGSLPVTWVFTGDSITHGALYTEGWRSFPEHFAERVRWELRRVNDVVINTGVFGERSTGLLANLEARVLRFRPEVVLVLIGMNDAVFGTAGRSLFRDNLLDLVGRIREGGAIPVLQTPNAIYDRNAAPWEDLPAYVDIIRDVSHESESPLIDHWRHWHTAKPDPAQLLGWLQDQSIHPNVYGHREMSRHICRTFGIYDPASLTCRLEAP
jgi:lysophospholipase L1-like esterase